MSVSKESAPSRKVVDSMKSGGIYSFLTMSWLTPLLWAGYKKPLEFNDLPDMPHNSQGNYLASIITAYDIELKEAKKANQSKLPTPFKHFYQKYRAAL